MTPYGTITHVPKYDICHLSFYLKCCLIGCFDIDGYGYGSTSSSIGSLVDRPTENDDNSDVDAFDRMLTSLVNDKHYALLLFILYSGNNNDDDGSNGSNSGASSSSSSSFSYHRQMHALSVYHDILLYQDELMNYHHAHFQPIYIQQRILYLVYDIFSVDKMIQWGYFIEDNIIVINNTDHNEIRSDGNATNDSNSAMNNRVLQNGELNLFVQMEIPSMTNSLSSSSSSHHGLRSRRSGSSISRIHKVMVYDPRWMEDYYYKPYDNLFTNNLFLPSLRFPLHSTTSVNHHHHHHHHQQQHHHHHHHPEEVSSNGLFVATDDGMVGMDDEEVDRDRRDEVLLDEGDDQEETTATTSAMMIDDTYAVLPSSSSSSSSSPSPDTPKSSS